mmetsp:Transcript_44509/g.93380  ORF Transcript_44509/g.93380 Transcript_44509/m.93380 type:complete len:240 (-) Transcript_44509:157-876(-)
MRPIDVVINLIGNHGNIFFYLVVPCGRNAPRNGYLVSRGTSSASTTTSAATARGVIVAHANIAIIPHNIRMVYEAKRSARNLVGVPAKRPILQPSIWERGSVFRTPRETCQAVFGHALVAAIVGLEDGGTATITRVGAGAFILATIVVRRRDGNWLLLVLRPVFFALPALFAIGELSGATAVACLFLVIFVLCHFFLCLHFRKGGGGCKREWIGGPAKVVHGDRYISRTYWCFFVNASQ